MPSREQVLEALQGLADIRSVNVAPGGVVELVVAPGTQDRAARNGLREAIVLRVGVLEGVNEVRVGFGASSPEQRQARRPGPAPAPAAGEALAGVRNVICVGSGKGGVGKSTMTANLATALAAEGKAAAALDCDVYGYSIPRMLGVQQRPEATEPQAGQSARIVPPVAAGGVKVMSIGFFVEPDAAVVWRGPMLHKAIRQFVEDVDWGELDYLLLDLPPGTGDVSMTLAQLLPQARFLIVTTPQPVAQQVARRSADMAAKVDLEIVGVIENMSAYTTPGGKRVAIFGEGGGRLLADELDVPLLAEVPLSEQLRLQSDQGEPLVLSDPDSPAAQAIRHAARGLVALSPQALPVLQPTTPDQ